jgi:adenosine deaminase
MIRHKSLISLSVVVVIIILNTGCATTSVQTSAYKDDPLYAIRNNKAALQYFFSQMPKGGDLHNHLTGSAYAETYFNIAVNANMYLDPQTFKLYKDDPGLDPRLPKPIQLSADMPNLHTLLVQCIDHWSVRNYGYYSQTVPPDEFFFGTFGIFGDADDTNEYLAAILRELRERAYNEQVAYLEIMLTSPAVNKVIRDDADLKNRFKEAIQTKDQNVFLSLLDETWNTWEQNADIQKDIENYVQRIAAIHNAAKDTAPDILSRYQAYCVRNSDIAVVFAQLYISFKACEKSPLLVGVNIVSPENGETSLRDFRYQMLLFRALKKLYPSVKTSMHSGELHLGLVPPEELNFHIADAVFLAGANRIGHGVDIAFESNAGETLDYMAKNNIPVEINLTSNEFILGVKGDEHPLMFYYDHKVPIILSTDDPGILRTDLTEQYTVAAQRYPQLTYQDFKQFAFNSLTYAFLPEDVKTGLTAKLEQDFKEFERKMNIGTRSR